MSDQGVLSKLRMRAGQRAIVIAAPDSYKPVLQGVPNGVELADALEGEFDFIHCFVTRKAEIESVAPSLKAHLRPTGILWVSYPKGKSIPTDLNRDRLWQTMLGYGLEANSNVAIDDVWSAVRFRHSTPNIAKGEV